MIRKTLLRIISMSYRDIPHYEFARIHNIAGERLLEARNNSCCRLAGGRVMTGTQF